MFGATSTVSRRWRGRWSARFTGLLPWRMLRYRAPQWWQELAILAVGYWLYERVRNLVPEQASIAFRHAHTVQDVQNVLHLNFELSVNRFVAAHAWLAQPMNYYYATLHFFVTAGVLIWLFRWHSHVYRGARTVLAISSAIGLVGFFLYPLAPPRLLPQYGYVDTVITFHTWGSLADPDIAEHSNQFAAMPSLHIAWALWCGLAVFCCARRMPVRILGLLYPVFTLTVIVGTANHFILDAVVGALVVAAAFGLQYLLSGHGAFRTPIDAPDGPLTDLGEPVSEPGRDELTLPGGLPVGAAARTGGGSRSAVENRLDDPSRPSRRPPIVVDQLPGHKTGRIAERAADRDQ